MMISQFQAGETVVGYFLIKSATFKSTNNNNRFLDINIADKSGEINAKVWDITDEIEKIFMDKSIAVIKIQGTVTEWQGKLQLKIDKVRPLSADDDININDLVPTAPYEPVLMLNKIKQYISAIENQDIRSIVNYIFEASEERLLYYPAAKSNHHSIHAGLLYHIMTMLRSGESLSAIYTHLNRDLLYAGIILHDIAKIDEMDANELGVVADYTIEGNLLGHIIQGIKKVEQAVEAVGADEEIAIVLQHMILSHHQRPEFGSPKAPMIPEAELLHYIDMIDSRMYDMHKAITDVEPSNFSDKVWSLENRRIYKPAIK
jgi:3'-5' exoribonuclease